MAKIKGIVARVGDGKFSKYIMLEGKDGFYFNTKFNPTVGVGDEVGITYTPKGDTRGNISDVKMLKDSGSPKGVQEEARSTGGGGGESGGARQDSIIWQHSQEMAIAYVGLLFETDALKIPAKQKEAVVSAAVDDATVRFFKDASNPKKSEAFKSAADVDEDMSEEAQAEKDDDDDGEWSDDESEWEN